MKQNYLLVAGAILTTLGTYAQISTEKAYLPFTKDNSVNRPIGLSADDRAPGESIVTDDFSVPDNWLIYSADGTDPEWEIVTEEPASITDFIADMASTTEANGFGLFNGIQYLTDDIVGVPEQDAYLEYGSTIDCSGFPGVILEFEQAYRAFNSDQTFVEVTNSTWDDAVIYELNETIPTNGPTIQEKVAINITQVAAGFENVKVRFRWLETSLADGTGSGYAWMVDDLNVREAWSYDQRITASYHRSGIGVFMPNGMEYYMIPSNQVTEITFIGQTESMAGVIQSNAKLNVDVTGEGTFSGVSDAFDLAIAGTDSVPCNTTFTPDITGIGDYNVTYYFDSDDAEEDTSNDSLYDSFEVTGSEQDFLYARDNGVADGVISNVTSNTNLPLLIGNVFDIFGNGELGAVDIIVSNAATNVGQSIFAQVMILNTGTGEFEYANQTDDYLITAANNGGPIKCTFAEDIDLLAGQTILVLAGHYGGAEEVEFQMAQGVDEQTVLGYTSGATDPFFLQTPSAIMVRPHMRSYIGIEDNVINNFEINQNQPNPFGTNSVINYELNEAAPVSVEFTDLSGKVVKTIQNGTQQAGQYTIEIDANDFAEGIYFYTFTVGSKKVTKRMVITK